MELSEPIWRRGRRLLLLGLAAGVLAGCQQNTAAGGGSAAAPPAFSHADLDAALGALDAAPAQGFAPGAFGDAARISALEHSNDPTQQQEGATALRKALIAYARAEHGLGLPRAQFPKEWGIRPRAYDAAAEMDQAIAAHSFADWLAKLAPSEPRYQDLVRALADYRAIAAKGGWPQVPEGPALRPGARDPRVAALRARLAVENPALNPTPAPPPPAPTDTLGRAKAMLGRHRSRRHAAAQPPAPPPADAYDSALAQAVADAQSRYGLKPTGVADAATIAALNVPAAARVNQIRANLERWRWLPRTLPATRVEVDAAGGVMDYYVGGQPALHMLAAAGKPDDQTPMLISTITQVEFNPPWKVPADIAQKELFPKEAADPGYFERNDFVKGPSDAVPLVQKAGPKSALGQVKFEFENPYGVYLHDTPAKSAFSLAQRQVSHGCVRLERATDLAKALLNGPDWPPDRVDQTIASEATSTVKAPQPTPVFLLYWTAAAENGKVDFRQDPYGWDDELVKLLDAPSAAKA